MNAATSLREVVLCNTKGVAALQKGDALAGLRFLRTALEALEGIEAAEENENECSCGCSSSSSASSLFSSGSVKSVLLGPLTRTRSCGGGALFALLNRAFLFVLNDQECSETDLAEATSIILYNIGMCHVKLCQNTVLNNSINNNVGNHIHNHCDYNELQMALKLFSLAADTLSLEEEHVIISTHCNNSNSNNIKDNMFTLVLIGNMGFLHELLLNDGQTAYCRDRIRAWLQQQQPQPQLCHPSSSSEEQRQDLSLLSMICSCPDVKALCERVIVSYHCPWNAKPAPAA